MVRHQDRLIVVVKVSPVHRDQDVRPGADLMRHPAGEALPHVDARVAHQTVHLLDRTLGDKSPRLRQSLANGHHRQRRARHHAQGRIRQRQDALGMQIVTVKLANETPNVRMPLARKTHRDHAHDPSANTLRWYRAGANPAYSKVTSK